MGKDFQAYDAFVVASSLYIRPVRIVGSTSDKRYLITETRMYYERDEVFLTPEGAFAMAEHLLGQSKVRAERALALYEKRADRLEKERKRLGLPPKAAN